MDTHSFEERLLYSARILNKYPDYVPAIIKKSSNQVEKEFKYLMPKNIKFSEVYSIIRKKINIDSKKAIFIFVNNTLIPMNKLVSEIYQEHKSDDNFLYMFYKLENTFG
jgi:GABA(A) receptor-associated protein